MKKVKVEEYKKPNYSTLKMVTGKVLPAGLAVAAMLTCVPNAQAAEKAKENMGHIAGGVPSVTLKATEPTPVTVMIDQEMVEFDVEPVLENGRVLVPLRKIFETLGADVTWDEETQSATATKGRDTIVIAVNDTKMLKNGAVIDLDVATKKVNDRILVPIRAISEGLGCDVKWDENTNQVIIERPQEPEIIMTAGGVGNPSH